MRSGGGRGAGDATSNFSKAFGFLDDDKLFIVIFWVLLSLVGAIWGFELNHRARQHAVVTGTEGEVASSFYSTEFSGRADLSFEPVFIRCSDPQCVVSLDVKDFVHNLER